MRVCAGGNGLACFELSIGIKGENNQSFLSAFQDSGDGLEREIGRMIFKAIRNWTLVLS